MTLSDQCTFANLRFYVSVLGDVMLHGPNANSRISRSNLSKSLFDSADSQNFSSRARRRSAPSERAKREQQNKT
ncbi:AAEL011660-PA [Aedes aegypti]|uniref:AAEL011660-PA n=1 Tax=Aedes aegypti TaxID=7159 RepID=Q16PF8_AEDAE|nr:AAEL011660-PA [Aedes aegypti]